MNRWKNFTLFCILLAVIVGGVFLVRRLQQPRPSEIERLFDGTEVVFIEGTGLLDAWRAVGRTHYWQSRAYEGLYELPPVRGLLESVGGADAKWVERVNMDTVMSAVGNESALAIYAGDASSRFLFASRVDPNFLLVDRLLAFAGADAGITVTTHRGLRVKEASLGDGRSIRWALDGDLLVCSNEPDIFYAALDRHVDGTTGRIVANRDFRRMKRYRDPYRLISGYAVTKRLAALPSAAAILPRAVRDLSGSIFLTASYADGVLTLGAEGKSRVDLFGSFSHAGIPGTLSLPDGVPAAVSVGRMPSTGPDTAHPPDPEAGLTAVLPYLFPDGFSAFIPGKIECGEEPGMIGVGGSLPSTVAAIDRLRLPGMTETIVTNRGTDIHVLEKDGAARLAWTVRGNRVVVSDRVELLADRLPETLETAGNLGYTTGRGEITLALLPRLMYREMERCAAPFPIPSAGLSPDQQRRLLTALYAAGRIDGYASIGARTLVVIIAIHVEDAIP
jgi:hypothetical protein